MKTINMHEAKTHLSRIVEQVVQGESFIIGKAGKPMALLSPYVSPSFHRKAGTLRGRVSLSDDFDAIDDTVADLFEGRGES